MVDALVVACGGAVRPTPPRAAEAVSVPARPGKQDLDPLLDRIGGRRLVVIGTDADLAAVVLRLLRTERLDGVPVGFVPVSASAVSTSAVGTSAVGTSTVGTSTVGTSTVGASTTEASTTGASATGASAVAEIFGLPGQPEQAMRLALHGDVDPVPLIRDDAGGVLVGRGVLRRVRGVVYCDDDRVLRGAAPRLEVSPDPGAGMDTSVGGLLVRVWSGRLFRRGITESSGRALQIGCAPNQPVIDGVEHERPVRRWTWYRHTANLRLVRGLT